MQLFETLISIQPYSVLILLGMVIIAFLLLYVDSMRKQLQQDRPFVGYSARMTPYEFDCHRKETTKKELAKLRRSKAYRTYLVDRKNGRYPPIGEEDLSDIE